MEIDNFTVYIIIANDASQAQNILSVLHNVHDFIYENFTLNTQIILSEPADNLIGLAQLYRSCIDAMEYNIFFNIDNILNASELNFEKEGSYDYPIEKEFQLISYIKSGDFKKAELLLDSLFEYNIQKSDIGGFHIRLLFYDIISTIMKAFYENDTELFTSLEQYAQTSCIK